MSTSWMERAKQRFSRMPVNSSPKRPETWVLGVLGVHPKDMHQKTIGVSGVLGPRSRRIPQKSHFSNQAKNESKNADDYMSESSGKSGQNLRKPEPLDSTMNEKLMRFKVLRAGIRVCDLWGDDEGARQAMRADIAAVPAEQLQDMYDHFVSAYSAFKGMPDDSLKRVSKLMRGTA